MKQHFGYKNLSGGYRSASARMRGKGSRAIVAKRMDFKFRFNGTVRVSLKSFAKILMYIIDLENNSTNFTDLQKIDVSFLCVFSKNGASL